MNALVVEYNTSLCELTPSSSPLRGKQMSEVAEWNRGVVDEFRANQGKLGGQFEGAPLLLLTTIGAKSGAKRVSPVMYMALDDSYAVFATFAGAPTNPAWYHNLVAHPGATIEVGDQTIEVTARVAAGEEHDRIWTAQKLVAPGMADYETKTDRIIPVVVLERRAP